MQGLEERPQKSVDTGVQLAREGTLGPTQNLQFGSKVGTSEMLTCKEDVLFRKTFL